VSAKRRGQLVVEEEEEETEGRRRTMRTMSKPFMMLQVEHNVSVCRRRGRAGQDAQC